MNLETLGRFLLVMGVGVFMLGGILLGFSRVPVLKNLGHLPGDIRIQGEHFACFFPIVSMCLLSIIASVILNVVVRLFTR